MQVWTITIGIWAVVFAIRGICYSGKGIAEPPFTEKLSIPLQQVACVVANNRELFEEETRMINQTKGYWYPDTSYWVYFGIVMKNDLGLKSTSVIFWGIICDL